MATPYATVTDLGAYLGTEPPADSQRMLARAQDLVDAALKSSWFAVDTSGNPTDTAVIAGLNKAVCAQVEWWISNGDEYDQINKYSSFSIEGISVTRSAGTGRYRLADRAWDALAAVTTGSLMGSRPLLPGKAVV